MSGNSDKTPTNPLEPILAELRKEFSEKAIAHILSPRNFRPMEAPDGHARYTGPCGDTMEIFLRVKDDIIKDASFLTDGCQPTIACGSMVVECIVGKSVSAARGVSQKSVLECLGKFPHENEHCALLATVTVQKAIDDYLSTRETPWKRLYRKV